jgi:hypothetical protein
VTQQLTANEPHHGGRGEGGSGGKYDKGPEQGGVV